MGPAKWGGIENVGDLVGTFPKLVPQFTFAILIFLENTFLAKERVKYWFLHKYGIYGFLFGEKIYRTSKIINEVSFPLEFIHLSTKYAFLRTKFW